MSLVLVLFEPEKVKLGDDSPEPSFQAMPKPLVLLSKNLTQLKIHLKVNASSTSNGGV